ncbi:MAG: response regulator [Planctomycetota bacterium]|nr:response regulator [Planctomycetota bacterium]
MTSQHRILLVDDDPSILRLAQFCLEDRGLVVMLAEDGDRALDLLRDEDFDLIVLDLMLPGKNGFEVLTILRSSQRNTEVPVYILSARATDEVREQAEAAGANGYIRKPFIPDELADTVIQALT